MERPVVGQLRVTDFTMWNADFENPKYVLWGHVFGDTQTHGNHPFPDGSHIHTSLVDRIVEEDGKTYALTRNSVYEIMNPEALPNKHDLEVGLYDATSL